MNDVLELIGKGRSGWHASGISQWGTVSCSSYDTREEQLLKFASQAEDGALVYDASRAGPEFEVMVLSGPMFDPKLPPDGVDRFTRDDRATMARIIPGLQGGFKTMAKAGVKETFCGFDKVGSKVYETILSAVPGVRIGHVVEGKVVWNEEVSRMIVVNTAGRQFFVRVVMEGDRYGSKDCLVHDKADPIIEFYDRTYASADGFGPRGQFVSRYNAKQLKDVGGLCLDGGVPEWSINYEAMRPVVEMVRLLAGNQQ